MGSGPTINMHPIRCPGVVTMVRACGFIGRADRYECHCTLAQCEAVRVLASDRILVESTGSITSRQDELRGAPHALVW